jgi:hypothetical protein
MELKGRHPCGYNYSCPLPILPIGQRLLARTKSCQPSHIPNQKPKPLTFPCSSRLFAHWRKRHLYRRYALNQLTLKWFVFHLHIPLPTSKWYASCLKILAHIRPKGMWQPTMAIRGALQLRKERNVRVPGF